MMRIVAIFDADGVLLKIVLKFLMRFKKNPLMWDILRKMAILFGGDRICDSRLRGLSVETIKKIAEKCDDTYVITKRPFLFGAKKRLMKQLDFIYDHGFFDEEHVFSSFLSSKGAVIRNKILQPNTAGFMVDDNGKNLEDIPGGIVRIWLDEHVRFGFHFYPLLFVTISDLRQLEEAITLLFP